MAKQEGCCKTPSGGFLLFNFSFQKLNHSLNSKMPFWLLGIHFVAQCSIYMSSSISCSQLPILRLVGCHLFSTASFCQMELYPAPVAPFFSTMFNVFSQPLNWQWLATLSYQKMLLPLTTHTTLPTTKLHRICWLTAELGKSIIAKLTFSKFAGSWR